MGRAIGNAADGASLKKHLQAGPLGAVHQKRWVPINTARCPSLEFKAGQLILLVTNAQADILGGQKVDVIACFDRVDRFVSKAGLSKLVIAGADF